MPKCEHPEKFIVEHKPPPTNYQDSLPALEYTFTCQICGAHRMAGDQPWIPARIRETEDDPQTQEMD